MRSRGLPETSAGNRSSLLGLAPGGVCLAVAVARDAGGLLLHRFTLACTTWSSDQAPSAVCSLLHFPSGRPAWTLSSTLPFGVRTFLNELRQQFAATVRQARTMILRLCELPSTCEPPSKPRHDDGQHCQPDNRERLSRAAAEASNDHDPKCKSQTGDSAMESLRMLSPGPGNPATRPQTEKNTDYQADVSAPIYSDNCQSSAQYQGEDRRRQATGDHSEGDSTNVEGGEHLPILAGDWPLVV